MIQLSRVTLYRNDLRGNKNYFELEWEVRVSEGLSYRESSLLILRGLTVLYFTFKKLAP